MQIKSLSIVIPVYNEEKTILAILQKVVEVQLIHNVQKEIIIVDDCSQDNSKALINDFINQHQDSNIQLFSHQNNSGKGAAIHTGIQKATGTYLVIQDADLEYDPQEFNQLLQPILDDFADVVYGSRFIGSGPHRVLFFIHTMGNKFLTFMSNMFNNLNLTDMETCYKMFRSDIIKGIKLKEKRFGFEPEVTAKISKITKLEYMKLALPIMEEHTQKAKRLIGEMA